MFFETREEPKAGPPRGRPACIDYPKVSAFARDETAAARLGARLGARG